MFSKSCEYAVRAVIYLSAESSTGRKVGVAEICEHILAPQHFTAKIMQVLTRNYIVSSQRGVNGGYYLNEHQQELKLLEIVKVVDGCQLFSGCILGLKFCSETEPCPLHNRYKIIRSRIRDMVEEYGGKKLKAGDNFRIKDLKVLHSKYGNII